MTPKQRCQSTVIIGCNMVEITQTINERVMYV